MSIIKKPRTTVNLSSKLIMIRLYSATAGTIYHVIARFQ